MLVLLQRPPAVHRRDRQAGRRQYQPDYPRRRIEGPVLFNVFGRGGSPTVVHFQAQVSNARIGAKAKLSIGAVSALGLNPTSGYTTKTPKTQALGKYITWKFTGGPALAGQRVNILVAVKVNGAWAAPSTWCRASLTPTAS